MSRDYPTFDEKFSVALINLKIRALLLGGVACNIYGSTRYSEDVDWWIDSSKGIQNWVQSTIEACASTDESVDVIRLKDHSELGRISKENFDDLIKKIETVIGEDGIIRFQVATSKIDAFYLPNNLEDFEACWNRARPWEETLRVLSVNDLILSKNGTGRKKDETDIQFLRSIK